MTTPNGLTYRGSWHANTDYATGDLVTYQGQVWAAPTDQPAGLSAPGAITGSNDSSWDVLAMEGAPGPQGVPGTDGTNGMRFRGAYSNPPADGLQDTYLPGDAVAYNGSVFITDGTAQDTPTDDDGNLNAGWHLFAAEGAQGIQGIQGIQGSPGPAPKIVGTDGIIEVSSVDGQYNTYRVAAGQQLSDLFSRVAALEEGHTNDNA